LYFGFCTASSSTRPMSHSSEAPRNLSSLPLAKEVFFHRAVENLTPLVPLAWRWFPRLFMSGFVTLFGSVTSPDFFDRLFAFLDPLSFLSFPCNSRRLGLLIFGKILRSPPLLRTPAMAWRPGVFLFSSGFFGMARFDAVYQFKHADPPVFSLKGASCPSCSRSQCFTWLLAGRRSCCCAGFPPLFQVPPLLISQICAPKVFCFPRAGSWPPTSFNPALRDLFFRFFNIRFRADPTVDFGRVVLPGFEVRLTTYHYLLFPLWGLVVFVLLEIALARERVILPQLLPSVRSCFCAHSGLPLCVVGDSLGFQFLNNVNGAELPPPMFLLDRDQTNFFQGKFFFPFF